MVDDPRPHEAQRTRPRGFHRRGGDPRTGQSGYARSFAVRIARPVNLRYATGTRNMQVWTMHNIVRYALVFGTVRRCCSILQPDAI